MRTLPAGMAAELAKRFRGGISRVHLIDVQRSDAGVSDRTMNGAVLNSFCVDKVEFDFAHDRAFLFEVGANKHLEEQTLIEKYLLAAALQFEVTNCDFKRAAKGRYLGC